MKKMVSALLMATVSVLVLFAFAHSCNENMTFWIIGEKGLCYLYRLDEGMNTELVLSADYIAYGDDTAVYCEDDGLRWTLQALETGTDTPILLAAGNSLTNRPAGAQIRIQDGYAYIPVSILDESKSVVDQYLLECSLDGTVSREICGLKFDIWNNFHVQNGNVYYIEMVESAQDRVMCYELKTGITTCLTELNVVGFSPFSYLDSNVLWRLTQEGRLSDMDTAVYATGYRLKDGAVTHILLNDYKATDDTNFWVNDGFVYCFRNRRLSEDGSSGMVADLWRINGVTGAKVCIRKALPYDNNFPPNIFFGRRGFVISDEQYDGDRYISTLKYINYDGSELVELNVPPV